MPLRNYLRAKARPAVSMRVEQTAPMIFITKILAFLKRDYQKAISYKFSFFMQIFGIFLSVTTFFFLSKMLGDKPIPMLAQYGGNYFAFVIIGVAFNSYLGVAINSLAQNIREGQMMGTLEALLVTQTGLPTIIFASSLYSFLFTSLRVVLFLLIGALIFELDLSQANYGAAMVILIISIAAFSSFGILSASFIIVLKKGDPVARVFTSMSWLLGGVYYPIAILPAWLKAFSYCIPVTYSLEGMRLALLQGYSFQNLLPVILSLMLFTLIVMPLSIFSFQYAIKIAKRHGSLTQY